MPAPSIGLGILAGVVASALALPAGTEAAPRVSPAARYGAVAHSPATLAAGWAVNYQSLEAARAEATYQCRIRAPINDCQVDVAVTNAWAALALSTQNGPYGYGWGPTQMAAANAADYYCRMAGGNDSCHVVTAIDATGTP
jgi:hypothetical protein